MANLGINIGGIGVGAGVNGHGAGVSVNGPGGGQLGAGVGAGVGGGGGVSSSWEGGVGAGANGNVQGGAGGGIGVGVGVGGGGHGQGGGIVGEGSNGQAHVPGTGASWGNVATPTTSGNGNVGGGAGIGVGVGIGAPVGGLGAGYLSPLPGASTADAAQGPSCTVQGGPARLLFFPPAGSGQAGITGSVSVGVDSPAQQTPITISGQTFSPGYAYLSCETLYATNSGKVVGPTFTNAIFPFQSNLISTGCISTASGQPTDSANLGIAVQANFGDLAAGLGAGADSSANSHCLNVAAPQAFAAIVPEWKNGLFWDVHFEPPQVLTSGVSLETPSTPGGAVSPPAPGKAAGASPIIVSAGYEYTPTTAPAGISPSPAGGSAAPTTPAPGGFAGTETTASLMTDSSPAPASTTCSSTGNSIAPVPINTESGVSSGAEMPESTSMATGYGGNSTIGMSPSGSQPVPYAGNAKGTRAMKPGVLVGMLLASLAWL